MKKNIITILLALVTLSACKQQDNYTFSGDLSNFVGLFVENVTDIDSVIIVNDSNHKAGIEQKSAVKDG